MFDKLYKEANDEIEVNTELMEKLKAEAMGEKRKKSYSFIYRYGFAAAILVAVASLNALPEINKIKETPKEYPGTKPYVAVENTELRGGTISSGEEDEVSENNRSEIAGNGTWESDISSSSKMQNSTENSTGTKTDKSKETVNSQNRIKAEEKEEKPKTDIVMTDNAVNEDKGFEAKAAEIKEETDSKTDGKDFEKEDKFSEPAPAASRTVRNADSCEAEVYSLEEHDVSLHSEEFEKINIESWNIPDGMTKMSEEIREQTDSTAEVYTTVYSGGDRLLKITAFSEIEYTEISDNAEEYNGSLITEKPDNSYLIYIAKNGKRYIVETKNIEKENVYSLIDSIG